jgi:hypothetical protein
LPPLAGADGDGLGVCGVHDAGVDVVGLYRHPPERAVVLCLDEKGRPIALLSIFY